MEEKINVKQALRVYQTITSKGIRQDDKFVLDGLSASSDFDGYTVCISNGTVSLTILFHNKFILDCPNAKAGNAFLKQLSRIDEG
ncbi:DUF3081 domain-containing protein [Exilibacterium tricleocarpae]|uniref:DUF3081 domain-containing protein n=1 Tax=Exilibacterium tricleocarpae TaxID=2591008 RepID=A0A545TNX7_9GAMM|nr:DUF3081 family protein [Exilibacterium tricleocarpae]TQV78925.1 DUF3081 domain-containing protein [Exilibacterium tricleocarpae]